MPVTVITVTNAPPSLRGDLTKWMQEIAVGVYIGNFNVKIREELWARVKESIGKGQATLSYGHRNELGYRFDTFNTERRSIDFDGIQLVQFPIAESNKEGEKTKGFSNASKFRRGRKHSKKYDIPYQEKGYVVLDIETDGLDCNHNRIIEIGAVKIIGNSQYTFEKLIRLGQSLPQSIVELTGITDELLSKEGVSIEKALEELVEFIGKFPIIGYSIDFDLSFINNALQRLEYPQITNDRYDLLRYIKRVNMFLKNYKLQNVLSNYGIQDEVPHRALLDAMITHELAMKVNGFMDSLDIVG